MAQHVPHAVCSSSAGSRQEIYMTARMPACTEDAPCGEGRAAQQALACTAAARMLRRAVLSVRGAILHERMGMRRPPQAIARP